MAEKKLVALGLICVVLAAGFFGTLMLLNQKLDEIHVKTEQISEIENEKTTLESQVSGLQTQTVSLNNEVDTLESQVLVLQSEKSTLETQVTTLHSETASLNSEVGVLEAQVSSLQAEVSDLENEVVQSYSAGYGEGESEGYLLGYDVGYVQGAEDLTQTGWYLRDPTYEEAMLFISVDDTDKNLYTPSYVCYDFTADFSENAALDNYRCGFVYIEFSSSAHAIACFNTTDQGLIYVEPQNDEIVSVRIGQSYLGQTIVDVGIIW